MSRMDGTTARMLLGLAADGFDNKDIADMYKEFTKVEGSANAIDTHWVLNNLGKQVKVKATGAIGELVKLNAADCGMYPGVRYPAIVKLPESNELLEFGVEQLSLAK